MSSDAHVWPEQTMFSRLIAMALFLAALAGTTCLSDAGAADDAAKKAEVKKKANKKKAAKKKAAALNTDAIFKKLDANSDGKLDSSEFKKLFSVQPEPKGKKGKELGPFDLDFTFKSLDANSDKYLSAEEFKGIVPAVFPQPKK
jgi:membrane protein involved in colicin uptake